MNTMDRTLFLIPGFRQRSGNTCFAWLRRFLKQKGFRVIGVPIQWNYKVMTDYVEQFRSFYNNTDKSKNTYVLGFSYGAVIAFMTAAELKPKKIYLCSLSPDFREDSKAIKPWWINSLIGKKRFEDIRKRSAREIARKLHVPSVIFYGETEGRKYPQLKARCEETAQLAKKSKLIKIKNAPHQIDHPEYKKAVEREFNSS